MPGFEKIRFTRENFHEDLICKHCYNILHTPQTCQICEINYCKECSDVIFKEQSKPENVLRLEKSGECVHKYKESSKYLINKLNKLELKCRFWFLGCEHVDLLENMVKHQQCCRKKMDNFNTVQDLLIKCPKGCQRMCTIDELQRNQHDCVQYLKQQIVKNDREYQNIRGSITIRLDNLQERMSTLMQNEEKLEIEKNKNKQLKATFNKINEQQKMLLSEYNDCGIARLEELIKAIQKYSLEKIQDKIKNSQSEVEELKQKMENDFFESLQTISYEYNQFKQHINKEILKNLRE